MATHKLSEHKIRQKAMRVVPILMESKWIAVFDISYMHVSQHLSAKKVK